MDEVTIKFSREAERYAMALREADERQKRRAREDPPADPSEDLESAERELARIRREPSPAVTDTVMSVVAGEEVE